MKKEPEEEEEEEEEEETLTPLFSSLLNFSTRNRTEKKRKTYKTGGNAGSIWQNACKKISLQDNVFVNNTVSI